MRRTVSVMLAVIILMNGFVAVVTVRADAVRSFAAIPCDRWITLTRLAGHQVTCGFVTVPESHSRPSGPTIQIAVVQIGASHPERGLPPVFYLSGGPGGPGITPGWTGAMAAQLATDRDYVTFDQRGVGYSQPNLECTESPSAMPAGSSADAVDARRLALYAACRDRLVRQGVDLTAYTSTESAADIEDIRIALGYGQINLLGISYGTRLALTMMRDFPASLSSVIIDSVSPLQEDSYLQYPISLDRSLHLLFDRCQADARCRQTYPDLPGDFSRVVAQLTAAPVTVRPYNSYNRKYFTSVVSGDQFVILVHDLLYSRSLIGRLPALIAQTRAGNTDALTTLIGVVASSPPGSDGMSASVRCNEYLPFADRQRTEDAAQSLLPEVRDHYVPRLVSIFDICAGWPTHPADPRDHAAVTSDIPTLVMESENDPTTPPDFGRQAAATLSHSFFIETPGIGHSVIANGGDCGLHLAIAFLNDPQTMPDTACTAQLGVVFSVTGT